MKILIVGAGRTGCSLIEALARKNYDITIIEKDKKTVEAITDKYNVSGFTGSGASKESLLAAGADTADMLFALTPIDDAGKKSRDTPVRGSCIPAGFCRRKKNTRSRGRNRLYL